MFAFEFVHNDHDLSEVRLSSVEFEFVHNDLSEVRLSSVEFEFVHNDHDLSELSSARRRDRPSTFHFLSEAFRPSEESARSSTYLK